MLSDIASHKKTNTMILFIRGRVKFIETESRMVVARGWRWGNGESMFNGYRVSVLQDEKISRDGWW